MAAAISGEDRAGIRAHQSDNLPRVVELRLTTGLRKIDGEWVVTHEHHSVPTVESRFKPNSDET